MTCHPKILKLISDGKFSQGSEGQVRLGKTKVIYNLIKLQNSYYRKISNNKLSKNIYK